MLVSLSVLKTAVLVNCAELLSAHKISSVTVHNALSSRTISYLPDPVTQVLLVAGPVGKVLLV